MSDASPQDLAVSFRSIARRRREARPDAPTPAADSIEREIDTKIGIAAGLMHAPPDPALVAAAIDAVHAKQWDEQTLASLRGIATDIGRLLRDLAAQRPGPDA